MTSLPLLPAAVHFIGSVENEPWSRTVIAFGLLEVARSEGGARNSAAW